jgi:hypothetical protein
LGAVALAASYYARVTGNIGKAFNPSDLLHVVHTQGSWKIDPGTATLSGAIIGLAIIGRQTRRGFANLIRSQNNQAELDRDAAHILKSNDA